MRVRNKLGRITKALNDKDLVIVDKWIKSGITDKEHLSKKIFLHFPISSYNTAKKYAKIALESYVSQKPERLEQTG